MFWVALVGERIDGERPRLLADGIDPDFTPGSLRAVERALSEWYPRIDWDDEDDVRYYEAIAAYAGEVLLARGGGRWLEGQGGRVPPIEADPVLGLPPLDIEALLAANNLRDAYAAWDRAVAGYEAGHPGWVPAKEPTPGIDPVPVSAEEAAIVAAWLAEQSAAFPAWVARYGEGAEWDRSEASLDALVAVALRELPTVAALDDPANAGFTEPACWYIGETLLHAAGGRWATQVGDPEHDLYAGRLFVTQDQGLTVVPRDVLEGAVGQRDAAFVHMWYEAFRGAGEMY